jgi:protein arginine kinase activator
MAERPVECSHCKKPIKVIYKEIVGGAMIVTEMCADCPSLQQRLHGASPQEKAPAKMGEKSPPLFCETCHTSLESVQTGNPLGCSQCYNVFSDILVNNLLAANQLPPQLQKSFSSKKGMQIHIGKVPNKPYATTSSAELTSLNEALNDAVRRENYEQAAWLRDQIKALLEKGHDGKK